MFRINRFQPRESECTMQRRQQQVVHMMLYVNGLVWLSSGCSSTAQYDGLSVMGGVN
jgi:cytochrome b561